MCYWNIITISIKTESNQNKIWTKQHFIMSGNQAAFMRRRSQNKLWNITCKPLWKVNAHKCTRDWTY